MSLRSIQKLPMRAQTPSALTAPTALSASPTLPPLYALTVLTLTAPVPSQSLRNISRPPMRAQNPSALTPPTTPTTLIASPACTAL